MKVKPRSDKIGIEPRDADLMSQQKKFRVFTCTKAKGSPKATVVQVGAFSVVEANIGPSAGGTFRGLVKTRKVLTIKLIEIVLSAKAMRGADGFSLHITL